MIERLKFLPTAIALSILRRAMRRDSGYAWAWHCNIAMAAYDAGCDHMAANEGAARFMRGAFHVDTTKAPEYRSLQERYAAVLKGAMYG